jgi:hypothetical protein
MVVRKLTDGPEAERIIEDLCRHMEWHFGVLVERTDPTALVLPDANPETVRAVLDSISPGWRMHVAMA